MTAWESFRVASCRNMLSIGYTHREREQETHTYSDDTHLVGVSPAWFRGMAVDGLMGEGFGSEVVCWFVSPRRLCIAMRSVGVGGCLYRVFLSHGHGGKAARTVNATATNQSTSKITHKQTHTHTHTTAMTTVFGRPLRDGFFGRLGC